MGQVEPEASMVLAVQRVNNPLEDGLLHHIFNHAPADRIKKTLEMTEGLKCDFLPPDPHCKHCAMARTARHKFKDHSSGKHNPATAAHYFSIGSDDLLDAEELEELQYEEHDPDEDEEAESTAPILYAEEDDPLSIYKEVDSEEES